MREGDLLTRVCRSAVSAMSLWFPLFTFGFQGVTGQHRFCLLRGCPEDHFQELFDGGRLLVEGLSDGEVVCNDCLDENPVILRKGTFVDTDTEFFDGLRIQEVRHGRYTRGQFLLFPV